MKSIYKPIPGVGTGRFGLQVAMRSQLYSAPDHLLVVQSTGYTEEYRRVFYRDIRYVDIRPSPVRGWIGVISGVLVLLLALLAFALPPMVVAILASPFLLWFIINLLLGPSVYCYITTNVQTLRLPAPRRRGKVALFVAFVRERAAETQPPVASSA